MTIPWNRFNKYLVAALTVALLAGCKSSHKKQVSTFRMQVEVNPDASKLSETISVDRQQPFMLTVERAPFLSEKNVAEAKVIDEVGGFAITVRFDRQGSWLLNSYTAENRGVHYAIFCQWTPKPGEKLNLGRWLAAPKIMKMINSGQITFTPDATREEADQIVIGLNNVAKKLKTAAESNW